MSRWVREGFPNCEMKEDRVDLFEKLLEVGEKFRRVNQYTHHARLRPGIIPHHCRLDRQSRFLYNACRLSVFIDVGLQFPRFAECI